MPVSNIIEKLGRAIFEAPFGTHKIAQDAPELAEIRIAVLDAVKAKSHRASGRNVFPYNLVRIHLLGVPDEQAASFAVTFWPNTWVKNCMAAYALELPLPGRSLRRNHHHSQTPGTQSGVAHRRYSRHRETGSSICR